MRALIYISLLACMFACKQNSGNEKNVAVVQGMFDAFNAHDWDKMASYYSETADFLDPSYGKTYVKKSRQEIASKYREMGEIFPDIYDELKGIYPSGNKVFVEFVATGTAPDGSKFYLPIGGVLTIENGLIVRDATYYDNSRE
ncbi:MAG: nuclear transport factor 2 family protein [Bacteroidota bacterium]